MSDVMTHTRWAHIQKLLFQSINEQTKNKDLTNQNQCTPSFNAFTSISSICQHKKCAHRNNRWRATSSEIS
uniref:Uncharacterized protein n=1 Tax=Oryza brachyantha TaxID=4533 RepID=J3MV39_ORYBR